MGKQFYCNFSCTFLDPGRITIGDRVLLGPAVQIYSVSHPLDPGERAGASGVEFAKPVVIEDDVWVGGGAIILPGVTVGKGAVVGAGAVVSKDVAPYTVVGGNPATVIKNLRRKDPAEGEGATQGGGESAAEAAGAPQESWEVVGE